MNFKMSAGDLKHSIEINCNGKKPILNGRNQLKFGQPVAITTLILLVVFVSLLKAHLLYFFQISVVFSVIISELLCYLMFFRVFIW